MKNVNYMKAVYKIGIIFAVVPPLNHGEMHKIYAAFVFFLNALASFGLIYKKSYTTFKYQPATVIVLDVICSLNIITSICLNISKLSIFSVEDFLEFSKLLRTTNKNLEEETNRKHPKGFYQFLITSVIFFTSTIYSDYVTIRVFGIAVYTDFVYGSIQLFYELIFVIVIFYYLSCLRACFRLLNDELLNTKGDKFINVEAVRKYYDLLTGLVIKFNSIFGWQILLLYLLVFLGVLGTINSFLVLGFSKNDQIVMLNLSIFEILVLIMHWFTTLAVMGVVVAVTCDMTTKEAQRTATVCYNLLLDIPAMSQDVQDRIMREELILLAQQATHHCPYFSAAGFFRVDYTMLFGLLGTVTSYIIVLIQINK